MPSNNLPSSEYHPNIEDFSLSLSPEEVLLIVYQKLKRPVQSLEGWAMLLSQDEFKDREHVGAQTRIPNTTRYIISVLDKVRIYLQQRENLESHHPDP